MKMQLLAFLTIAVLAVGADIVLKQIGFSSSEQSAGNNVRLSDQ